MKILAITQARLGSNRLPEKILKEISKMSILEIHLKRLLKSKLITKLVVATTNESEVDKIIKIASKLKVSFFKGSMDNVLDRFYKAAINENPDLIVRVTSDCPLIDPDLVDKVIDFVITKDLDYCSNTLFPTFPDGVDVEVFKFSALTKAYSEATMLSELEHVTPYIWKNSTFLGGSLFTSDCYTNDIDYSKFRITVDTPEDFLVIEKLINAIGIDKNWLDYIKLLEEDPVTVALNSKFKRNEGYQKSLNKEQNL